MKAAGGRPTRYRVEYADQAFKICLLGATDEDLARFFDVSVNTIDNWKKAHPEFLGSLKAGKEEADAKVAQSLYRRALGYEHEAVKILTVADGNNAGSHIEEVPYTEHYPPDTTAAIFWLKNRRPTHWRDKQDTGAHLDVSTWEEPEFLERVAAGEDPYKVAADRMRYLAEKQR